jgi:uncharacterized membrane protein (DUF485 family)
VQHADYTQKILQHPEFIALLERRRRFAWQLSAAVLAMYASFMALVAFAPAVLATPVSSHSSTTWGIPIGIFIIVMSFLLTGVYVKKANTEFDEDNERILRECLGAHWRETSLPYGLRNSDPSQESHQ